jgi:hypothetical protein
MINYHPYTCSFNYDPIFTFVEAYLLHLVEGSIEVACGCRMSLTYQPNGDNQTEIYLGEPRT